jgi:aspartyl-tRNA(Asn)/glutamyl-tRNA(Gln) amidotransferase subunit B
MFEKVSEKIDPVLAAKWLRRELMRVMNYNNMTLDDIKIDETHMVDLLRLVEKKTITDNVAKEILEKVVVEPFDVKEYVKKEGLEQVSDSGELEKFVKEAMDKNPQAVEDIKAGNTKSVNFIVGQVMRATRGKANPQEVNDIIKKLIS